MNQRFQAGSGNQRGVRAFTLIELLVVIALIVLLVGAIGVALRGGDRSTALQGAQGTLISLFAGARAKAALHQTTAALIVDVDEESDGYLRTFRTAYLTTDGEDNKWVVDDGVSLPAGIFLVPDSGVLSSGIELEDWNPKYVTTALDRSGSLDKDDFDFYPGGTWRIVYKVTQYGTREKFTTEDRANPWNKVVLAPGERSSAETLVFRNPDLVRGAVISHYGVLSIVNDPEGFN